MAEDRVNRSYVFSSVLAAEELLGLGGTYPSAR